MVSHDESRDQPGFIKSIVSKLCGVFGAHGSWDYDAREHQSQDDRNKGSYAKQCVPDAWFHNVR